MRTRRQLSRFKNVDLFGLITRIIMWEPGCQVCLLYLSSSREEATNKTWTIKRIATTFPI